MTDYQCGYTAFNNGLLEDDCPFIKRTGSYNNWCNGWNNAYLDFKLEKQNAKAELDGVGAA